MSARAFSQSQSTTAIRGAVTDTSGAAVPQAQISVLNIDTRVEIKTETNGSGSYNVPQLTPGHYAVTITRAGFRAEQRNNIDLALDQTAKIDAQLQIGEFQQTVVVNTAPPLLDTENTQIETVFSPEITQNLPLVGRTPTSLATLAPGTSTAQSQAVGVGSGGAIDPGRVNVGGGRSYTIDAVLNGGTVLLPATDNFLNMIPSLAAISEFSVVQNNFGAQYGSGTSVLNMIIKSGTNQFHGSAFEYIENDGLNAISYFAKSQPKLVYNQFGGSLGGPIIKNRLFFFVAYQNTRSTSSVTSTVTVPTVAELGGDFSAFSTPLIDPMTKLPFARNMIPKGRFDAVALNTLAYWPAPNCGGAGATTNNYCQLVPTKPGTPIYDGRIDWTISSAHQFSFAIHEEPYNSQNSGLIPGPACFGSESCGGSSTYDQAMQVSERWVVSSTAVNSAYMTYVREHYANTSPTQGGGYPAKLGLTNNNISQLVFPRFTIQGTVPTGLGPGGYYAGTQNSFIYSDVFTWVRGKHTLNIGGQYNKQQVNNATTTGAPTFTFNGQFTGIGLADFLLGQVSTYAFSAQPVGFAARRQPGAAFVQDDWKLRPNITFNLGIRYQYEGAFTESHNRTANFSPTAINPATQTPGAIVYATPDRPNIQKGHPALFAPRVGFAISLPSEMVLRGAYGIYYNPGDATTNFNASAPGYSISQTLISPTPASPAVFQLSQGPPAPLVPTAANRTGSVSNNGVITWWPSDAHVAYSQQWHLSVEKQLSSHMTAEISYVGGNGVHLLFPREANQVPLSLLGTPLDQTNPQQLRPFPQYLGVTTKYNDGLSNYNSLQAKVNRRFSNGLTLLTNYTYSKSMDNSSLDTSDTSNTRGNSWQIASRPDVNRALSDFDLTHRGVIAYVYDLPVGRGLKFLSGSGRLLDAVLGGWTNSGSFVASSGTPFTVFASTPNLTGSLAGSVFANCTTNTAGSKTISKWFNTSAFSNPAPYKFGNCGRNSIRGPRAWNFDFALMKNFRIWRETKLQFRADAFNVFNHPNPYLPNATLGSTAFGTITTASPPRVLQLGAQYTF